MNAGGDFLFLQVPGEVDVESRRLHSGNPGDILPVVLLQLPEDEVMAQVDEPDLRLPLLVQSSPGQTGDGLGRQGLMVPVRENHSLLAPVPSVPQGQEPVRQLLPNGYLPVWQHQAAIQKVHLLPGEMLDFIPQQPGLPGQAQHGPRSISGVFPQRTFHRPSVRAVHDILLHSGSSHNVMITYQITASI